MTTVTIAGREFVLGAAYAPAEPLSANGQRRAPRRLVAYDPPERCRGWYVTRDGLVRLAHLSGNTMPPWSGEHWAAWVGEEVGQG